MPVLDEASPALLEAWQNSHLMPDRLTLSHADQNEVVFAAGSTVLGRDTCLRLHFDELSGVSQFHARIEWDEKPRAWKIRDMNSSYGTKVNGRKVRSDQRTTLKDGSVVTLAGTVELRAKVCLITLRLHMPSFMSGRCIWTVSARPRWALPCEKSLQSSVTAHTTARSCCQHNVMHTTTVAYVCLRFSCVSCARGCHMFEPNALLSQAPFE